MASSEIYVKIDSTRALRDIGATMNTVTIVRMGILLDLPPEGALDWLIAKVAQFRGISESEAITLLRETDLSV